MVPLVYCCKGTSEQVPLAVIWHLRNPVATEEAESLLLSDPGFFRGVLGQASEMQNAE